MKITHIHGIQHPKQIHTLGNYSEKLRITINQIPKSSFKIRFSVYRILVPFQRTSFTFGYIMTEVVKEMMS